VKLADSRVAAATVEVVAGAAADAAVAAVAAAKAALSAIAGVNDRHFVGR
jgi:hypothetical protein